VSGRRLLSSIRRRGAVETGKRFAIAALSPILLRESHYWYALDLQAERPRVELGNGFELVSATPATVAAYEELPTISAAEAAKRLGAGNDGWLVRCGGEPVFGCWVFRERAPVLASPTGELVLPQGFVCLEDSVTARPFRGRGIAPAAWSAIGDRLAGEGERWMVTKVEQDNVAVQRSLTKVGFVRTAEMRFRRTLGRSRTELDADESPPGRMLRPLAH